MNCLYEPLHVCLLEIVSILEIVFTLINCSFACFILKVTTLPDTTDELMQKVAIHQQCYMLYCVRQTPLEMIQYFNICINNQAITHNL